MSETYGTYDPATRPGRQATAPEAPSKLLAEDGTELPEFDAKYTEDFTGLNYIGALTKDVSWLGHTIVLRTLGADEQLAISLLLKPYVGTQGEQLAYTTAVVALAVVTVDGQELPTPIGEDQQVAEWAQMRFGYVKANWYSQTIAYVFQEYLELEDRVAQVVTAMGKAFGQAPEESPSTLGSTGTSASPSDGDS